MGSFSVKALETPGERQRYFHRLLTDIEALEQMLSQGLITSSPIHIGAEQEFCLVDEHWDPSDKAVEILPEIGDPHLTSELTRYNLEINLDPRRLEGTCFSDMHRQLNELLDRSQEVADKFGNKIVLTGILPTIKPRHMTEGYMTPQARYVILNEAIQRVRAADLELHIKGVDELNLHHKSIMYEGCNTSFQAHLQLDPADFANTYNWAQAIAGPILSVCTNSPMLMGQELWEETRIALFTQSVDTRKSTFLLNRREPRVGFGTGWVSGTPADFYKQTIARFRSLISTEFEPEDSLEQLAAGRIPRLSALNLHNGTVYPWNRLCYGRGDGNPHLRIECRYLPSGPTTTDEIANLMLWVGVMAGRPKAWDAIHEKMDFRDAKKNFFNAARYGMAAQFHWDGKIIPTRELMLDFFLPLAYKGLARLGVAQEDVDKYLTIIQNRMATQNGAEWMVQTYRKLLRDHSEPVALRKLTACLHDRSRKGYTVDAWKQLCRSEEGNAEKSPSVGDLMSTRIITAQEDDSAALVIRMMDWNGFHHLPVLNDQNEFTGMLSWSDVAHLAGDPAIYQTGIRELMKTELITTTSLSPASEALELMKKHRISCLPVLEGKLLTGLITTNDF